MSCVDDLVQPAMLAVVVCGLCNPFLVAAEGLRGFSSALRRVVRLSAVLVAVWSEGGDVRTRLEAGVVRAWLGVESRGRRRGELSLLRHHHTTPFHLPASSSHRDELASIILVLLEMPMHLSGGHGAGGRRRQGLSFSGGITSHPLPHDDDDITSHQCRSPGCSPSFASSSDAPGIAGFMVAVVRCRRSSQLNPPPPRPHLPTTPQRRGICIPA